MRFLSKGLCSLSSSRISVCIVGSGPAGFYTAEKILKAHQRAEIDIIDRLPTPFGLVRSGVAPDHPETKELNGIYSAREFVWWYNGHPDCFNLVPNLKSTDTTVILGLGNVALDVARILLRPASVLAKTDISDNALASLQESTIKKVYLVARRGPAQAACTAKELREILSMKNLHIKIQKVDLDITPCDEEEMKSSRIHKRVYELLSEAAASPHCHSPAEQRELNFVFFRKPSEFLPSKTGCVVGAVRLEKTILKENGSSCKQMAIGAGEYEDISCGLVLKSIGYKSIPVDGLPFDYRKGIVPNVKGRVLSSYEGEHEAVEYGLYVSGWLKRGPTGIVATNLYCAEETVGSISEDVGKGLIATDSKPGREGLLQLLQSKNIKHVCFNGWEKIDAKEKKQGLLRDRPREKLTTWDELLRAASN